MYGLSFSVFLYLLLRKPPEKSKKGFIYQQLYLKYDEKGFVSFSDWNKIFSRKNWVLKIDKNKHSIYLSFFLNYNKHYLRKSKKLPFLSINQRKFIFIKTLYLLVGARILWKKCSKNKKKNEFIAKPIRINHFALRI